MAVTVVDMARTWQRRLQARQARADERAHRLQSLLPRARDLLVDVHGAQAVRLFGSIAGGGFTEHSDVDLAVEGLDESRYFAALADLMALFGGPVDLVRVESAAGSLKDRIADEGRPL
jgi:predicted nucleotidyltransferase